MINSSTILNTTSILPTTTTKVRQVEILRVTIQNIFGGARGVVVIVVGNGHGDTSLNPGRD